jgi:hypothetical protein
MSVYSASLSVPSSTSTPATMTPTTTATLALYGQLRQWHVMYAHTMPSPSPFGDLISHACAVFFDLSWMARVHPWGTAHCTWMQLLHHTQVRCVLGMGHAGDGGVAITVRTQATRDKLEKRDSLKGCTEM